MSDWLTFVKQHSKDSDILALPVKQRFAALSKKRGIPSKTKYRAKVSHCTSAKIRQCASKGNKQCMVTYTGIRCVGPKSKAKLMEVGKAQELVAKVASSLRRKASMAELNRMADIYAKSKSKSKSATARSMSALNRMAQMVPVAKKSMGVAKAQELASSLRRKASMAELNRMADIYAKRKSKSKTAAKSNTARSMSALNRMARMVPVAEKSSPGVWSKFRRMFATTKSSSPLRSSSRYLSPKQAADLLQSGGTPLIVSTPLRSSSRSLSPKQAADLLQSGGTPLIEEASGKPLSTKEVADLIQFSSPKKAVSVQKVADLIQFSTVKGKALTPQEVVDLIQFSPPKPKSATAKSATAKSMSALNRMAQMVPVAEKSSPGLWSRFRRLFATTSAKKSSTPLRSSSRSLSPKQAADLLQSGETPLIVEESGKPLSTKEVADLIQFSSPKKAVSAQKVADLIQFSTVKGKALSPQEVVDLIQFSPPKKASGSGSYFEPAARTKTPTEYLEILAKSPKFARARIPAGKRRLPTRRPGQKKKSSMHIPSGSGSYFEPAARTKTPTEYLEILAKSPKFARARIPAGKRRLPTRRPGQKKKSSMHIPSGSGSYFEPAARTKTPTEYLEILAKSPKFARARIPAGKRRLPTRRPGQKVKSLPLGSGSYFEPENMNLTFTPAPTEYLEILANTPKSSRAKSSRSKSTRSNMNVCSPKRRCRAMTLPKSGGKSHVCRLCRTLALDADGKPSRFCHIHSLKENRLKSVSSVSTAARKINTEKILSAFRPYFGRKVTHVQSLPYAKKRSKQSKRLSLPNKISSDRLRQRFEMAKAVRNEMAQRNLDIDKRIRELKEKIVWPEAPKYSPKQYPPMKRRSSETKQAQQVVAMAPVSRKKLQVIPVYDPKAKAEDYFLLPKPGSMKALSPEKLKLFLSKAKKSTLAKRPPPPVAPRPRRT